MIAVAAHPAIIHLPGGNARGEALDVPSVQQDLAKDLGRRSDAMSSHEHGSPFAIHRQLHDAGANRIKLGSPDVELDRDDGLSSGADGPARKRRRSRKGLDKKFECPQDGCGKSYSRAEHLYRHQLNHAPKQIFNCDFPGCTRSFVRADLCNRHRDRHTAKGSQLSRRDSLVNHQTALTEASHTHPFHIPVATADYNPHVMGMEARPPQISSLQAPDVSHAAFALMQEAHGPYPSAPNALPAYVPANTYKRCDNESFLPGAETYLAGPDSRLSGRPATFDSPEIKQANLSQDQVHNHRFPTTTNVGLLDNSMIAAPSYIPQDNFTSYPVPPSEFTAATAPEHAPAAVVFSEPGHDEYSKSHVLQQQAPEPNIDQFHHIAQPATMAVFGGEEYSRLPFTIPEDLVAYLFSGPQLQPSNTHGSQSGQTDYADVPETAASLLGGGYGSEGFFPQDPQGLQRHMAVTSLGDSGPPGSIISEEKSQAVVDLIRERFNENGENFTPKHKDTILGGDRNQAHHIMSRKMMEIYIASYWYHFSEQMPLLHKPTFIANDTPNLLLLVIITLGAAFFHQASNLDSNDPALELPGFLAWHLRWELFSNPDFRPPAKLWIFQALLLLETYEKLFASRTLHERAHVHHATTITLMRRGSSLIGRSSVDSPSNQTLDRYGPTSSRQSPSSLLTTHDEWWKHWVTKEATRRAAFAAFVLDSTHATMFGHSTVMVAHEMRLPLPCDDSLWYALNGAEVGRLEANLHASGLKPISFLEGIKRTLNAQEVRTNAFGRTILMAGLLSVSWHMNQRDLQVNSLGVSQALGGRDKWRGSLTRAFDLWKQDFDRSLVRQIDAFSGPYLFSEFKTEGAAYQSRVVLHHFAHMAMHVDIVDCQIFARAKRLLGRSIGPQDLLHAQRRMQDVWAPTAKARDATWYALRFLRTVLLPDDDMTVLDGNHGDPDHVVFEYSARRDVVLNRPWVIYFAALIIWAYGYALEGPTTVPLPASFGFDDQVRDMRSYLRRLGGAASPEELKSLKGFNGCSGLLLVLRAVFQKAQWELLGEAAVLLGNCVSLVKGLAV